MPAQKRPVPDNLEDDEDDESYLLQHYRRKQPRRERRPPLVVQLLGDDDDDDDEDSEGIDPADLPEFINVDLADVRRDVQCAICLGIIKKTRTVMGCMHRFCRECIDKSMRLGNNECPACRMHCASRRSLRDDSNYDNIITLLYQDIEKYEEEELSLHEEEKTRNKQIQASIARIFQRQSDALNKRVRTGKDAAVDASTPGLPPKNRKANARRGRNNRNSKDQESNDDENENEQYEKIELSSSDEHGIEIKKRKSKRGRGAHRRSQAAASAANLDNGCFENEMEARNEVRGTSLHAEHLSWGGGGARSHTRHGSAIGSKGTRNARLSRLVDHLQHLEGNNIEVHIMLISLDKQRTTSSKQLHLCCNSHLSVKNVCELVAKKASLEPNEVEMLLVKETTSTMTEQSTSTDDRSYLSQFVGQAEVGLVTLKDQETLAELQADCICIRGYLIFAYRRKDAAE